MTDYNLRIELVDNLGRIYRLTLWRDPKPDLLTLEILGGKRYNSYSVYLSRGSSSKIINAVSDLILATIVSSIRPPSKKRLVKKFISVVSDLAKEIDEEIK